MIIPNQSLGVRAFQAGNGLHEESQSILPSHRFHFPVNHMKYLSPLPPQEFYFCKGRDASSGDCSCRTYFGTKAMCDALESC